MRARIERAVQVEQQSTSANLFHERVKTSLKDLVRTVQHLPQTAAAHPSIFDEEEASDDLPYWTKPELPEVVSVLCSLERLVKERVAAMKAQRVDNPSYPDAWRSALYVAMVRHLLEGLVTPVMEAYTATAAASLFPTPSAHLSDRDVCVRLAGDPTALFAAATSVVRLVLPVHVYVCWRCCFRLLNEFQRELHMSAMAAEERENDSVVASWLDVASAMLDGLQRVSQASATLPPLALKGGGDGDAASLAEFRRRATLCARTAHCYWWWMSFTYVFGSAQGWIRCDASLPSAAREAHLQLWCTGRLSATRHLSSVALPAGVQLLSLAMIALIFAADGGSDASATRARMRTVECAVANIRAMADALFPLEAEPRAPHQLRAITEEADSTSDAIQDGAALFAKTHCSTAASAAAGFVRLVVHEALRPVAERILDDPSSLQVRPPTAGASAQTDTRVHGFAKQSSPSPAPTAVPREGWDDEDAWEEVQVMGSGTASTAPEVNVQAIGAAEAFADADTLSAARAYASAPPVTCAHDAVVFVLHVLEMQCGEEMVQHDAIAMTLRRLL